MIEFESVSKFYKGKMGAVTALKSVSLTIAQGDIYGIIGFSGAGKSTLLRMINRLERPDEGRVLVEGQNLAGLGKAQLRALRRKIGMVFQQFNLLESKTVYQNIAIPLILEGVGRQDIERRVDEVLRFVELEDKKHSYVTQLSGGQKQRVGIARALATGPSVLLCDEATSALDPKTTDAILQLLKRVNREMGVTVVLITHQMQVIQSICNRVAVMEAGQVVEEGGVTEVFSAPKLPVTRDFVKTVVKDKIPQPVLSLLREERRNFRVERLQFIGEHVREPLIARVCRTDGVEVNILGASVEELEDTVLCVFLLQCIGEAAALDEIEDMLDAQGILRERLEVS